MRLINASSPTLDVEEFLIGSQIPPYAILSHTWDQEEVTLDDMQDLRLAKRKKGLNKIEAACRLAKEDGLQYVWVDTCCIDKTSSAELSEAINSMYRWYQRAAICYVYLADLIPSTNFHDQLPSCRWFKRGWTLQELLAPQKIDFFDADWNFKGVKHAATQRSTRLGSVDLGDLVSSITGVDQRILRDSSKLSTVSIAKRMSWAVSRQTTRTEDMAYCLLGIFDVNMPLLYGEEDKAFMRLQQTILQTSNDLSIFAWRAPLPAEMAHNSEHGREEYCGILANSISYFETCGNVTMPSFVNVDDEYSVTNKGIRMDVVLESRTHQTHSSSGPTTTTIYILNLGCHYGDQEENPIGIFLRKIGASLFVRCRPTYRAVFRKEGEQQERPQLISILTRLPGPIDSLIISHRTVAVQIRLPKTMRVAKCYPQSHWDGQDQVFFSTTRPGYGGWGMAELILPKRHGKFVLFYLFDSYEARPQSFGFIDASPISPILSTALQRASLLDHTQAWDAYSATNELGTQLSQTMHVALISVTLKAEISSSSSRNLCSKYMWEIDVELIDNSIRAANE
jgi:hypothetical protein